MAGTEFVVVPVVMIRQGVLNSELALAEEFGRLPEAWNGIPVPLGHPMLRGVPVSANCPEIVAQCPGRLYHVNMDGDRLLGEIWMDVARVNVLGGDALLALQKFEFGEPVEVSTAYFRQFEPTPGIYDNVAYLGIQREMIPDHLAILLHQLGACDWQMGCGAPRINQQEEATMPGNTTVITIHEEMSLDDKMRAIYDAFTQRFQQPQDTSPYIREIYEDHVIARQGEGLVSISFEMDADGNVTWGEPVAVEIVYQPVGNSRRTLMQWLGRMFGKGSPAVNAGCPCAAAQQGMQAAEQAVEPTVENAESPAAEVPPTAPAPPAVNAQPGEGVSAPEAASSDPVQTPAVNQDLAALVESLGGAEAALTALEGLRQNQSDERQALLAELQGNERCQLGESDMSTLSLVALRKLRDSLQPANYGGRPLPRNNQRAAAFVEAPMPISQ